MTPILVLTVLASAIAAAIATYYLNISKERLFFIGQKYEELYRAVETLDSELSQFFAQRYSLIGKTARTSDATAQQDAAAYFATSRMLIGLYFPVLSPELARVSAAAATAQRSLNEFESAPELGDVRLLETLDASVCDLKEAFANLKTAILTRGCKLQSRKFFALSWQKPERANGRQLVHVHS